MSSEDKQIDNETSSKGEEPTLYRGKWTPEEEAYAHCLIAEFRAGTLDIPSGTTLRGFLAKKLECAPKRVSKKFENTGYNGKQLYCSSAIYISSFESEFRKRNLEFLRQRFLMSRGRPAPKGAFKSNPQDFMFENLLMNGGAFESRIGAPAGLKRPAALLGDDASRMGLLNLSGGLPNSCLDLPSPSMGMLGGPSFDTLPRDIRVTSPLLPSASPLLSRPLAAGTTNAAAYNMTDVLAKRSAAAVAANAAISLRKQALRDLPLLQSTGPAWNRPLVQPSSASLGNNKPPSPSAARMRDDLLLMQLKQQQQQQQQTLAAPVTTSAQLRLLQQQAEERKHKADPSGDIGCLVRPVKRVKMF